MPPKRTWSEPKLRDAMFCHLSSKGPAGLRGMGVGSG